MTRRIEIDPLTRVEGHGKVTIRMDDAHNVVQTRLHIVEFRGFERFVQGRPYWEAAVLVQRLCGICPVSHHLCAAKAMDVVLGLESRALPPTADKMRRLMHYGQVFQSHVLHFFHLASPDLLFGVDADPGRRNLVGLVEALPDVARRAVLMRKFGQDVIQATAGKKIHGTGAVPGGINRHLSPEARQALLSNADGSGADTMVSWALDALALFKDLHRRHAALVDGFAAFPSNYLSLVAPDGAMDLYDGGLRAVDRHGRTILDQVDVQQAPPTWPRRCVRGAA
ncbi:MAG: nickel-dependent hydrogenase large subunit [Vicinamibacterales bacterium]